MPEPLHLFDLPVDILALILANLLTAPNNTPIPLCPCTTTTTTKSTINPLPIFLIHPSLYAIAHPLFYGPSNTFLLDLTGNHASHVRHFIDDNAADDFHDDNNNTTSSITHNRQLPLHRHTAAATGSRFLLLSQESRRKVRKLEMRIDRLRGWLWDDLGPFLQDMAVRGSLADMTLLVDESCKNSKNSKDSSSKDSRAHSSSRAFLRDKRRVFERPPLEGLVRLLADPGIRQARLRVRGRHQRAWCEFHAGRECASLSLFRQRRVGGGGEGSGEGGALAKEEEEEEEVVDVDWRAILSRTDPEGRRRAVAWQV